MFSLNMKPSVVSYRWPKNCDFPTVLPSFLLALFLIVLKGQTGCSKSSKYYDSPQGRFKGQIDDFPRVSGLLSIQARLHCTPCFYLPRFTTANHKG